MSEEDFLDRVYRTTAPRDVRDLYDDWAPSYDERVGREGYVTPGRIAAALAARLTDLGAPVLDFGCGTGLCGRALAEEGFATIDGCDISAGMLEEARATGAYRRLWQAEAEAAPDIPRGYAAITASGVISVGAAAAALLDPLLDALGAGGLLAFSFNDHTFQDPDYTGRVASAVEDGRAHLRLEEAGAHLPGIGLGATVFVLERR